MELLIMQPVHFCDKLLLQVSWHDATTTKFIHILMLMYTPTPKEKNCGTIKERVPRKPLKQKQSRFRTTLSRKRPTLTGIPKKGQQILKLKNIQLQNTINILSKLSILRLHRPLRQTKKLSITSHKCDSNRELGKDDVLVDDAQRKKAFPFTTEKILWIEDSHLSFPGKLDPEPMS
ncbi:hypothetical protein VNO77_22108 [Canavalia gladiata]|uniref:Uncharacterized protein n=1 Tax=Canavalia gladiata TaxID=3824 RepID=A0AAN9L5H1_CANGL